MALKAQPTAAGLIHIPKSGGTALKTHSCSRLWIGPKHGETESSWIREYCVNVTLVVMREPTERFISAFEYALRGTSLFPAKKQSMNEIARMFRHAGELVDALRARPRLVLFGNIPVDAASSELFGVGLQGSRYVLGDSKPTVGARPPAGTVKTTAAPSPPEALSVAAWDLLIHREAGIQFRAANWWLDPDLAGSRAIVCYNSTPAVLSRRVEEALKRKGINCSFANIPQRNSAPSTKPGGSDAKTLTPDQAKWVREQLYGQDWALWRSQCGVGAPEPLPYCPRGAATGSGARGVRGGGKKGQNQVVGRGTRTTSSPPLAARRRRRYTDGEGQLPNRER